MLTANNAQSSHPLAFGLQSLIPPLTDPGIVLQRIDEVNMVQRMLSDAQTSAVIVTGESGAGKSTLASLLFRRLQAAAQSGAPTPRYFIWLGLGRYTTIPDILAAILSSMNLSDPAFFFLKPEQQITLLVQALRRPQENALVVLDHCEGLFDPENSQGRIDNAALPHFLSLLQTDLGASRLLLTSQRSPFNTQYLEESRVRSYLVSRISLPEGIALLQQRGVQGSPEELSIIWQRCAGHTFALVLFSSLVHLSGLALSYLLNAPDYQSLWSGEVTQHLTASVYQYLNPVQISIMRTLCLFTEPVPQQGLMATILGDNPAANFPLFEQELNLLKQLSLVNELFNAQGVACYSVPSLLNNYIVGHFLEGRDQALSANLSSALGVSGPLGLPMNSPEAQQVALAAGHMKIAAYYQRLGQDS